MAKKLPKSLRKYIRREKARIRREVLTLKEQEELIQDLYQRFYKKAKTNAGKKEDTEEKELVKKEAPDKESKSELKSEKLKKRKV